MSGEVDHEIRQITDRLRAAEDQKRQEHRRACSEAIERRLKEFKLDLASVSHLICDLKLNKSLS